MLAVVRVNLTFQTATHTRFILKHVTLTLCVGRSVSFVIIVSNVLTTVPVYYQYPFYDINGDTV